jgi:hypothetical protein
MGSGAAAALAPPAGAPSNGTTAVPSRAAAAALTDPRLDIVTGTPHIGTNTAIGLCPWLTGRQRVDGRGGVSAAAVSAP